MTATKNLLIRPIDIGLNPLGAGSSVADAVVSVTYDRVVYVDGHPIPRVPIVETSVPTQGVRVPVIASDDPSITEGAGFAISVVVRFTKRRGEHPVGDPVLARTIQVVTADPDEIPLGSKSNLTVVPDPTQYADVMSAIQAAAETKAAAAQVTAAADGMVASVTASKDAATQAASSAAAAQQSAASMVGPTDAGVAQLVQSGVSTRSVLYRFTGDVRGMGLKCDGTDEGAALQAAIDGLAGKQGARITIPTGTTVTTSQTITVPPGVQIECMDGAIIRYTGSGSAVIIDNWDRSGQFRQMGAIRLRVQRARTWSSSTNPDTTSVGVTLRNANFLQVRLDEITGFETGLLMLGDGVVGGCAYNDITLGTIVDNKRGIRFAGINSGWANQNTFHGGNVRLNSNIPNAGTIGIDLSATGNNNTWLGTALESGNFETVVTVAATDNMWLACRWEGSKAGSFKWLASSYGNTVFGGYAVAGPGDPMFADASGGRNIVIGHRGINMLSDSSAGATNGGMAAYEARGLSTGDALFRGRATDGTIRWEVNGRGAHSFYASNSVFPIVMIDPTSAGGTPWGGFLWGRGTAAPDTRFSRGAGNTPSWIANAAILKRVATQTLSATGPLTVDCRTGDVFQVTLSGNATATTLYLPVTETGYTQEIELSLIQDATGSRTWVPPTNVMWAGGTAPALTTTAGARDILTLRYDAATSKWVEIGRSMGVK